MAGTDHHVLVIGGGPGGYAAALRAAQHDLDVTLVEKGSLGGTCLNHGCIPSKALISAGELVHRAGTAAEMGIYAEPYVDYGELVSWKDDVVRTLTSGVETLCSTEGVSILNAIATFQDRQSVSVDQHDGGETTIDFDSAIIATGSRPIEIPGFSYEPQLIINSRQALSLESIPPRLLVVGAGYIGMELSTTFAKLGADVTVVEQLDSVLPQYASDLSKPVHRRAEDLGIDIHLDSTVLEWEQADGQATVHIETGDGAELARPTDRILVAVGREPVTGSVGLDAAGIETTDFGFIETDARGRTANENVFAVGDVAGEPMLAHAGIHEGIIAAETAAREPVAEPTTAIPSVVFTDPEIATVGLAPNEAEGNGEDVQVGEFPFRANGRALTRNRQDGFVRIVADETDGRVRGAQIVGPEASELIAEYALAIETSMTLEDLASTVHPHPTLSETVGEAAEQALKFAIHTPND